MITTKIKQTDTQMKQESKRERIDNYKKKNVILNVEKAWETLAKLNRKGADIYDTTCHVDGRESLIGFDATH